MKNEKYNFNTKMSKETYDMLRDLKDKYAVNISQAFKIFIKEYHEKMKKINSEK